MFLKARGAVDRGLSLSQKMQQILSTIAQVGSHGVGTVKCRFLCCLTEEDSDLLLVEPIHS